MDRGTVIFVGAMLTFASSWVGLVYLPYQQLNGQQPFTAPGEDAYPRPYSDKAAAGAGVYAANGCIYCHSQQVRSEKFGNWWENGEEKTGADIRRGWGSRRNVSRDYLNDRPPFLGTMRTGPDVANVGSRYSAAWQHQHLFNARSFNSWSTMPSFAFLYRKEKVEGTRAPNALRLGREWTVNPGYRWRPTDAEWDTILAAQPNLSVGFETTTPEGKSRLLGLWLTSEEEGHQVVPTADAENLVAYLLELRKAETPLPEAKE
ncbi:cbb3-type cytochrome c oxidase subunit II [Urbifossiella limnaea]|uniref:Cytochrome C oxidase, mono-heme subunit/FixO n=1 Tax=Urbifossiella limnaea TaxID=2528023 RepID=A0A517XL83_9BACT|nr:cbb3-type cytochrome c oxidase subunit II [Urbifossiella limnaea]QDU18271.1 Cytochrome C oxidase, mono-heme subunit/FixO [Urbifossiella limnaea]